MNNFYFLLFFVATLNINGQIANCDDANSYLVNAYSHVKDAYDSNNISHLKYYANRSLEAFKLSKKTLKDCGCETALNLTNKSIDLLAKVEGAETFEDGRFFVKRARDTSKESVIEIDKCSYSNVVETESFNTNENTELSDLQDEQLKLKLQQEALKIKENQIKQKLEQQEEKALMLKKEALILSYKMAITENIRTYNDALKVCDCKHDILKEVDSSINISKKSIKAIKSYYINKLKTQASNYLSQLNLCEK